LLVERVGRNVRLTEAGQVWRGTRWGFSRHLDAPGEEVAAIAGTARPGGSG
jgi:hypothetical protein